MVKVCIWLGPSVVCLQIYCWSPAIYVPNWRQNLKKASTRRQGPKNYRQFWAEQFSARKRTAAGKIELGGADPLILSSTTKLKKPERRWGVARRKASDNEPAFSKLPQPTSLLSFWKSKLYHASNKLMLYKRNTCMIRTLKRAESHPQSIYSKFAQNMECQC